LIPSTNAFDVLINIPFAIRNLVAGRIKLRKYLTATSPRISEDFPALVTRKRRSLGVDAIENLPRIFRSGTKRDVAAAHGIVMDENRGVARNHVEVVVVVAGDGEVPHPAVVDLRGGTAVGDRDTAVGGLKMLAGLEVTGG
jgi:hypothetical protein